MMMKLIVKERIINKSREYLYKKWTPKEGLNSPWVSSR